MLGKFQNQMYRRMLEDREKVHFMADRNNTVNSEKMAQYKRLNTFESKAILTGSGKIGYEKVISFHAPPKILQWLPIQG